MLRKLRPRSCYDVMAAIAFFIAVAGGSAYAAATIGSGNIKNNAVLSRHIKDGEIKSRDLNPKLKASLRLHCPAGLKRAADICFESSPRPQADWAQAVETCAAAQRRLPDAGELGLVFDHLGSPQGDQWVASTSANEGAVLGDDSSRNIQLAYTTLGVGEPYRCVTSATNSS